MKISAALLMVFRMALPDYHYRFPADFFNHPDFRTEWWYYTGNIHTAQGRRFGFELTFFRQGADGEQRSSTASNVWDVRDVWLAHLALSDLDGGHFYHVERMNRSGPGIAGADAGERRVWNGNWQVRWTGKGEELQAVSDQFELHLAAKALKPPVIHGINGVSQKSEGSGHASHYFSETRLSTHGTIILGGQQFAVDGLTWMDHEFFTHQMAQNQKGWDWFSLQFDDGSELMLYRLRRHDGSTDPFSAGTYVDVQGRTTHLAVNDFAVSPGKKWRVYPIAWEIRVPKLNLNVSLSTRMADQELTSPSNAAPSYWEGAIEVVGIKHGSRIRGQGYLEMTGYVGGVRFGD
jgi:predicted secreted hydrolase